MVVVRGEPEAGVDLLGVLHVVLQRRGHARRVDLDHALVALLAFAGRERDHEAPGSEQVGERLLVGNLARPLRGGAQRLLARALHDDQLHAAVALELKDHRALEFERGGEQGARGHQLTQDRPERRRVFVALDHGPPCRVQMGHLPADGGVFEKKALQSVFHGL